MSHEALEVRPVTVAAVAQISDLRKLAVPLPQRVATPLKLSLAPLLQARKRTPAIRMARLMYTKIVLRATR